MSFTLAQVPNLLRVEGSWPGLISLRAGWFRARARPWNEVILDPMVRLDRGGTEFLLSVAKKMFELGASSVYSPALYGSSTGVWTRSGFRDQAQLDIMERDLNADVPTPDHEMVTQEPDPDWSSILDVDRAAFEGFWGMSRLALEEAHRTNHSGSMLIAAGSDGLPSGYAIVGAQWGNVYLHRIAVRPEDGGKGLGNALLAASIAWGRTVGGRSMVLNVRPENERAKRLYESQGFVDTGSRLRVLRLDRE